MGRKSTWKLGTKVRWFLRDLPPGGGGGLGGTPITLDKSM